MNEIATILVDDGGVITDNSRLAPQYRRVIAEILSAELGGDAAAWEEGNRLALEAEMARMADRTHPRFTHPDRYNEWYAEEERLWLHFMFRYAGVKLPSIDECERLWKRYSFEVPARTEAYFEGAPEAVRELQGMGFRLATASGAHSRHLRGTMTAAGIVDCLERLYGPDLIGHDKMGSEYYRRIMADLNTRSAECLVVDDMPVVLEWARAVGAATVGVGEKAKDGVGVWVERLAELPRLLRVRTW